MKNKFEYNRKEREQRKKNLRVKEETLKELAEDLSQASFEKDIIEIVEIKKEIDKVIQEIINI